MLTSEEKKMFAEAMRGLEDDVGIRLVVTDNAKSSDFQTYSDLLSTLSPGIRIHQTYVPGRQPPSLEIDPAILLHALPHGTELPPFMALLAAASSRKSAAKTAAGEDEFEIPALLKLYVSPFCPHCPLMLQKLFPAALAHAVLHIQVIDTALFPGMAQADGIKSVPTLILDDDLRWTGIVDMQELFAVMRHRNPAELSMESLRSMITHGDAFRLAEMMRAERKMFPAFYDLLTHAEFSTRLGAMAVAETLAEEDKDMVAQLIDPLIDRFETQSEQVRGDILYILGEAGDRRILPFMEDVISGECTPDVKEAAADAIQRIRAK